MEAVKTIACPNCGATIGIPTGVSAVKCPYCGYQISLLNQTVAGLPAYLLPLQVKKSRAIEILVMELSKQVGVSEETISAAEKASDEIIVVPYVIYDANAVGTIRYHRYQGDVAFKGEVAIAVPENLAWMDDIHIPPAARVPFDPSVFQGAKVLPAEDIEGTERRAKHIVEKKLQDLAQARGQHATIVQLDVKPVAVVYVPFHHLTYGENHAIINGANGEILVATYTQRSTTRALALGGGMAAVAAGIITSAVSHATIPTIIGIIGAIPLLAASVTRTRGFGSKVGALGIPDIKALLYLARRG